MKKLLFFLVSFFFLFPQFVFAKESGWQIDTFHSAIQVQPSGVVSVSETIAVDFKNLEKHGIYRDIPYVYTADTNPYYTEVSVGDVLQDNRKVTTQVYNNGSYIRIRIGDADETISGKHTYVISYSVTGIIRAFKGYDEAYWNVTGNQWGVPITSASANVTLPKNGILQFSCYQGYEGSKDSCTSSKINEKTAHFQTTSPLAPSAGMTVAVGFAHGMVPILTVSRPKTLMEKLLEPVSVVTFGIVLFSGIFWIVSRWYSKGRDFWKEGKIKPIGAYETTVVEFTPPEKLRPAEIGVLMDEKADTLDVTATIIDLTTRGYLSITEIPKKWVFGNTDYEFKRLSKSTGFLSYEKMLLDRLFTGGNSKKVSTLKNDFYDDLAKVKEEMYAHMMEKGVFVSNSDKIRTTYVVAGIFLLVLAIFLTIFGIGNEYVFMADVGLGLIPVGILTLIFAPFMPRKTAYGTELYRRVKGYREFINTAEKYRQRFFEQKDLFNEVLPYAIVFGLTKKFADAMKEIGLKNPQIVGYYGAYPFNAYTFSNSVDAFSNSFSSAAASTPSSSGSGGGGSSGGGFGGGGGGSW